MKTAMADLKPPRHRITADEYHRMAATGLLNEDSRVVILLKPRDDFYASRFATGEDTLLVADKPGIMALPGIPGQTVDLSRLLEM